MLKKLAIFSLVFTIQIHSMDEIESSRKDIKTNLREINDKSCLISSESYKLDSNNNIIKNGHSFTPTELESQFNNTKKVITKNVIKCGTLATIMLTGFAYGIESIINRPTMHSFVLNENLIYLGTLSTAFVSYTGYRYINDFKSAANKTVELYKKLKN